MIRWVWWLALAALAIVATCAQLDRASQTRPELSLFVPAPFRSFAQVPATLIALASEDPAKAQSEARRLVVRRPMPAEHVFALAMAELRNGRPEPFANAFRAASTRGWRFGPLQVAAAQAAIDVGDAVGAANRIAALWAAEPENPSLPLLTKRLLQLPGGSDAFATRLAGTNVWQDRFLTQITVLAQAPDAMRLITRARALGARFDCAALDRFAQIVAAQPGARRVGDVACT